MEDGLDGPRRRWRGALALAFVPALIGVMPDPAREGDPSARAADGFMHPPLAHAAAPAVQPTLSELLDDAERRLDALEFDARRLDWLYRNHVDPIVRDLVWLQGDSAYATRIALALVREGLDAGVDPRLLLAVMRVENPWLELRAMSPKGAVGLMQVMPFHAGGWGCGGDDLTDLDLNVCHGTRILARLMERYGGNVERALLGYNGCVGGANTPDCGRYPSMVLAHLGEWGSEGVAPPLLPPSPATTMD